MDQRSGEAIHEVQNLIWARLDDIDLGTPCRSYADPMARRSLEQMHDRTGMTQDQRDVMIYALYRRRLTQTKIARRVGVSVGAVQASLKRTAERQAGLR